MMHDHDTYVSPLATRNASERMLRLFSARTKFTTWRRIWCATARAQHELGLPVTLEQVEALEARVEITDEDLANAGEHETRLRHDVMAHVHAYGDACPDARGIIHLGMTSQDVVCNADVLLLREAIDLTVRKLQRAVHALASFADTWKHLPTLGFTHYQPAQPTTVGRRAANWAYDLQMCVQRLDEYDGGAALRFRGMRGATGTQASFLDLFEGDASRVDEFEQRVLQLLQPGGSDSVYSLTGQTYPRVADCWVLADLAGAAAVVHKIAGDVRLLSNRKEIDEPFGSSQIGSSAMPYKRNPMRCERICGLTRFVMSMHANALNTASTQWLERTLDDSSNRRLSLPEAFLALDGAADLLHNVASGLVVHRHVVHANLMAELPFMASERILAAGVRAGGDRQDLHERMRQHSHEAGALVKGEGKPNDLIERLRADPVFGGVDLDALLDPSAYVGRSAEQVEAFLEQLPPALPEGEASEPRV